MAACSIVKFPADAPPARQVFANAFLARVEAAISDLDSLTALDAARAGLRRPTAAYLTASALAGEPTPLSRFNGAEVSRNS